MTVPAGAEITIYNAAVKKPEVRVALGLDYAALTAQKQDLFSSGAAPNAADWWYTQLGGAVLVSGGDCLIRSKGGPSYELLRTREHWVPASETQPFEHEWILTFPQTDPVYTPVLTVGSLQQTVGADIYEPLQIQHRGSATRDGLLGGNADQGKVMAFSVGAERYSFANDQASHTYLFQWDPAKAVNAFKFTYKVDGVTRFESDTPVAPRYFAFGWVWSTINNSTTGVAIPALTGTQTLIQIHSVTSRQLGAQGYESRTYPAWTTANAGGTTLANAAEGERVSIDGETWAIIPVAQIKSVDVERNRSALTDTFSVTLKAPKSSNPDATPNWFAGDRWTERPILIDTRVSDESTATAWKRQMAGRIKRPRTDSTLTGTDITLSGRCEALDKLDTYMSKVYLGASDTVEAANVGFPIDMILDDLVDASDTADGSPLGATDTDVKAPDIIPSDIGSGGDSLLTSFVELCDETAQEYVVRYTTSGTGRYGEINVNAWTLGAGTAGYTFRGKGGGAAGNIKAAHLEEDSQAGPGQASYRQNIPVVDRNTLVNTFKVPAAGLFPTFPYPANARVLSGSIAFAQSVQATALLALTDKDGGTINGGVAIHRWRAENTRRRQIVIECWEHDWMDPTDEIAVDDPSGTGVTTSETWVIDGYRLHVEDARMTAEIRCFTSDWFNAIRRAT